MSRRTILSGAASSLGVAWGTHVLSDAAIQPLPVTQIADGIFVGTGQHAVFSADNAGHIANVGFVIGRDAVAVIDTGGSATVGHRLLAAIRSQTSRPIGYVINTHMHPDHVFGNAPFATGGTTFVGHSKLPRALASRADRYLSVNAAILGPVAFAGTAIIAPSLLVADKTTLDLGGRILMLTAHRTAHTDNDLTVRDERTGTLFMGDLLFSGHIPTLDGSIKGWLALLDALKAEPANRVVPGHGPASMGWPEAMAAEAHYLSTVAADVRAILKDGRTLDDAMKTAGQSARSDWLLFDEFHARTVTTAFAELEWE